MKKITIVLIIIMAVYFACSGAAFANSLTSDFNSLTIGAVLGDEVETENKKVSDLLLGGTIECYLKGHRDQKAFFTAELGGKEIAIPHGEGIEVKFTPKIQYLDVTGVNPMVLNPEQVYKSNSEHEVESFETSYWIDMGQVPENANFLDFVIEISWTDKKNHTLFIVINFTTDVERTSIGMQRVAIKRVDMDSFRTDLDLLRDCKGGYSPKYGFNQELQAALIKDGQKIIKIVRECKLEKPNLEILTFRDGCPDILSDSDRQAFLNWELDPEKGITVANSNLIWLVSSRKATPTNSLTKVVLDSEGKPVDEVDEPVFPFTVLDLENEILKLCPVGDMEAIKFPCPFTGYRFDYYRFDSRTMWQEKVLENGKKVFYYPIPAFEDRPTCFWIEEACIRVTGIENYWDYSGKWFFKKQSNENLFLEIVQN